MSGILWRVIIAIICVTLALALIGPFCEVVGLSLSSAMLTIIRICVAGIAVLYVLGGGGPWPWTKTA